MRFGLALRLGTGRTEQVPEALPAEARDDRDTRDAAEEQLHQHAAAARIEIRVDPAFLHPDEEQDEADEGSIHETPAAF